MKSTKRRIMPFTFYDRSGIARELEKQAEQGWMLEKTSAAGWIYHRIEPAKIHFSVVYFPTASAFDPHPSEKQQQFRAFCEHTGWELISSNTQLQIFCNRSENPVPIETDPVIELENIHTSVKKTVLSSCAVNLVLAVMQIGLAFQRFSMDVIGELANLSSLISLLFWVLVVFTHAAQILLYFKWYLHAKAAADNGYFLETRSTDRFQITMLLSSILAVIFLLLSHGGTDMLFAGLFMIASIVGFSLLLVKLTNYLKKKNVSARRNKIITYAAAIPAAILICSSVIGLFVNIQINNSDRSAGSIPYEFNGRTYYVYQDNIPLRIDDLIETSYDGYSYETISDSSSPLLQRYEARQKARYDALEEPEMRYQVVTVRLPFLYDMVQNLMRKEFEDIYTFPDDTISFVDPAPWGANEVYQFILGEGVQYRYLICYKKCIVDIHFDWKPTEEQMAVVRQKLTGS